MEPPPLSAGMTMTTVVLSPVIGGLLRTWESEVPVTWQVDDAPALSAQLGRGDVARAPVGQGRFREVGLLTDLGGRGVLMVPQRFQKGDGVSGVGYELSRVPGVAGDEDWDEFGTWLRAVIASAAERGDIVVLERAGWDAPREPHALFSARRRDHGWVSYLEAAPAPSRGQSPWPQRPPQPDRTSLTAPATRASIGAAAMALVTAAREWAASPHDVGVTFGKAPDGPMPEGSDTGAAPSHEPRAETPAAAEPPAPSVSTAPPRVAGVDGELAQHLDELGAHTLIRQFVSEVARRRSVVSQRRSTYVNLRRDGSTSVAMYVHRAKVSLSLHPRRAAEAAAELPGAVLQEGSASTSYLVVDEDVLRTAPQQLVALAVEAVDR